MERFGLMLLLPVFRQEKALFAKNRNGSIFCLKDLTSKKPEKNLLLRLLILAAGGKWGITIMHLQMMTLMQMGIHL